MSDHVGRSVGGGRYVLRELLGKGGMASVHLAWDTVLERQVAIKTMHARLGTEGDIRQRFKREAQAVAKLTHTNIVAVFDTGEEQPGADADDDEPVPYIVMEYVEGRPLRAVLEEDKARHGAMPPQKALAITADVLAALGNSHEMGIVHRDIKPGNVMVTPRGVVKVMDFGIARATRHSGVSAMTQTGAVVGTPQYLSPEQALGRAVDARADLYSVGVMLFELLTGRLPFDAENPLAMAYAHVQEEPPAPSSINAALTPAIDALVARMLAKNPDGRFPSAEAARGEVRRLAEAAGGAMPRIVPGAHTPGNSGAGVAQAVFPDLGTPGTAPVAVPGTPAGAPYGPHPATPPHGPAGLLGAPGTPGGRGTGSTVMVVVASVVAITLVAAIAVVVILNSGADGGGARADGEKTTPPASGDSTTASPSVEDTPRFESGDPTQTIDPDECAQADEWYDQESDPGALTMPDFYDVHIDSVKACIQAAGWVYDEDLTYKDEVLKGEGMVVDQSPEAFEPYNPDKDTIELTVSTGMEPAS
jgi:eukaryotic-like serine/threonine-protein kinase